MNKRTRMVLTGWVMLVAISLLIPGCATIPGVVRQQETRFIKVAAKLRTPSRVVSAMLRIGVRDDGVVQVEIADPVGITHSSLMLDHRSLRLFDLKTRCSRSIDRWVSRLSHLCGVQLTFSRVTGWILPAAWPDKPRTIQIARRQHLQIDIEQIPPAGEDFGRVIIRIPARGVEISMNWIEADSIGSYNHSIPSKLDEWNECSEQFEIMDWIR